MTLSSRSAPEIQQLGQQGRDVERMQSETSRLPGARSGDAEEPKTGLKQLQQPERSVRQIDVEPFWKTQGLKFRTEWICLKCSKIYEENDPPRSICYEVLPNGRLCGGPLCPRIFRIYR